MKKARLILFLVFSGLLFGFPIITAAQTFDFNRAYQDYLYHFGLYQQAHQEYTKAKNIYLTYQTLAAKQEAQQKTLAMLQRRDEVVRTYLTALKLRLAEADGITPYEKELLYNQIDLEVAWYPEHQERLPAAGSLEDLAALSSEAEKRFTQAEKIAARVIGMILAGKEAVLNEKIYTLLAQIEEKIGEIRLTGDKETSVIERWLLESAHKLTLSREKYFAGSQIISRLDREPLESLSEARLLFLESHQYKKESVSYLNEVLEEVKIAD